MGRTSLIGIVVVVAAATPAGATELVCAESVNGRSVVILERYPAAVAYAITITNAHPSVSATAVRVDDPLLASVGFAFSPAAPFRLAAGDSRSDRFTVAIASYSDCLRLAGRDGTRDRNIDTTVHVGWEIGDTQCSARVACRPPPSTTRPPPTRALGFWKTHPAALGACLDGAPVSLGGLTVATVEEALGLLWAAPGRHADGTRRARLDQLRLLLGRQLLVALCNARLLGGAPDGATLLADAVAALDGSDCEATTGLVEPLAAFNDSGESTVLPAEVAVGPTDVDGARAMAVDPTTRSGADCGER